VTSHQSCFDFIFQPAFLELQCMFLFVGMLGDFYFTVKMFSSKLPVTQQLLYAVVSVLL